MRASTSAPIQGRWGLAALGGLLLMLGLVVAPALGNHVPGAKYAGTTSTGGFVRLEVSADGSTVTSFGVDGGLPSGCGSFSSFGYGGDPIIDHAFSRSEEGDSLSYSGSFPSEQRAEGALSVQNAFDPSCAVDATWTAEVLHTLTVNRAGSGTGEVQSSPYGIDCGRITQTCSAQVSGKVTLTAKAEFDSYFVRWSGAGCSGSGKCEVQMDADKTVTATFDRWKVTITKRPKKRTTKRKATFAFNSTAPGSRFQCEIDYGEPKRCSSPKTYKKLEPGPHRFDVHATGPTGRDYGPSAHYNWKVKG